MTPTDFLDQPDLAMLLAALAAFAGVIGLALPAEPDTRLQARLRQVARERDQLREQRLSQLSTRRKPKLRKNEVSNFTRFIKNLGGNGPSARGELAARLIMAGFRGPGAEAVFMFFRTATPIAAFLAALLILKLSPGLAPSSSHFLLAFCAALLGYSAPRLLLDRLVARRQKAILKVFPDALDLLLICVQSGMSVESALGRVTKDISRESIELAEEFSLTMAELSYLPSRWRAYANLGERIGLPAVKLITTALVQAERHGTSISQALASAAKEGREARIAEAERKAAAMPPKLSIPLVIFFLPVLLTVILAPALMQAGSALNKNKSVVSTKQPDATGAQLPAALSSPTAQSLDGRSSPYK